MKIESKYLAYLIAPLLLLPSCRTIQYVPVEHTEYIHTVDSVYVRDTTIQYQVEKEYVRDYTGLLDTLDMETGVASARAWVDTSKAVLAGEIRNKENVINVPASVKEKVVYKDRIVTKEIPVEVEVVKTVHPKYEPWLWSWGIASLLVFVLLAYCFLKKKLLTL